ncbi:MAG: 30S ribosomal protein S11 [Candidatus Shikimatogenerans sp. AspAUS03]|uniref:Small ribosomal subunit protein uS11 n=1 Tax=Candidatus Shikimatogenerans sp. AspAUS03 TaxID=3158563 RepID=A0AAU7QSM5_9FLAO
MKKKIDKICNLYIKTTYNNTIISLTNLSGEVLMWSSSGKMKFKGSKKNTSYAAQISCQEVIEKAIKIGLKKIHIFLNGPGLGKESSIKTAYNLGIKILSIKDITAIPHNGCRPSKKRRI